MSSVKVAVRVRPFNQRELDMQTKLIIDMKGKKTRILNTKIVDSKDGDLGRERYKDFTFDYSYWSFNNLDANYAPQEQVFRDLGMDVIECAFGGYNACVFAYGQTGSGKTFTMMGSSECVGLIPRICQTLFERQQQNMSSPSSQYTYRTEVSYLEIYNERVRDLLVPATNHSLRVREHPRLGPYVQDLSKHLVTNYPEIEELMVRGNNVRTTASTNMNDTSSRSHAIFTLLFTQAGFLGDMPTETLSKIHLVDLAGSERADATGATGKRLQEGAHINKSLVTLGSVISALADASSPASDGSTGSSGRKASFIPYRDSVLTWLLKDSLGGNSKTIMIAAVSPADCNYGETLSTLRYANRAKNIVNKPTVNEDPNVRLIRELREEIKRLRSMTDSQMSLSGGQGGVLAQLHQTEARAQALTEEWAEKWRETAQILSEQKELGLRKAGKGVVLDSNIPHLVLIDDDLRSTGVTLYHLKEGKTQIGSEHGVENDINLSGMDVDPDHCAIELRDGIATLIPAANSQCWVNSVPVDKPTKLSQGCIILLGRKNMFRYNDPVEAAKLRREGPKSHVNLSRLSLLSWSTPDLHVSLDNLNITDDEQVDTKFRRTSLYVREKDDPKREQMEREQILKHQAIEEAQHALDQEKERVDQYFLAQSRRLAEDRQRLELQQQESRAVLAQKESELQQLREALLWEQAQQAVKVEAENAEVNRLKAELQEKKQELSNLESKMNVWTEASPTPTPTPESSELTSPSPLSSPSPLDSSNGDSWASTTTAEQLSKGVAMQLLIEQHKKHILMLDAEFEKKLSALVASQSRVDRLDSDISKLNEAKPATMELEEIKRMVSRRTREELDQILERKQSFTLDLKEKLAPSDALDPQPNKLKSVVEVSSPRSNLSEDMREFKTPMTTPLNKLQMTSPELLTCDISFHTACASPCLGGFSTPGSNSDVFVSPMSENKIDVGQDALVELRPKSDFAVTMDAATDTGVLSDSGVELEAKSCLAKDPLLHSWIQASRNNAVSRMLPHTHNQCDDSDEVSSSEDYVANRTSGNAVASSAAENSSSNGARFRNHHRSRYVNKALLFNEDTYFDVRDAKRTMNLLCERISNQKALIIQSLEDDSGKQELHEHIAVLQDLQRQHLRLEILLEQHLKKSSLCALPTLGSIENSDDMSTSADDGMSEPSYSRGPRESVDNSKLRNVPLSPLNPVALTFQDDQYSNISLGRSRTSLHSFDDGEVIHIHNYVLRGAGSSTHFEYDVRINAGGDRWTLLRRYKRFRDLHKYMSGKYGAPVAALDFPRRRLFSKQSEEVARKRKVQLEMYLRSLITLCSSIPQCSLHSGVTRQSLMEFSPFFKKGGFESSTFGTS